VSDYREGWELLLQALHERTAVAEAMGGAEKSGAWGPAQ